MMADRGLTILIDTREQKPIDFSHDKLIAQEIATLSTGDYTLKGFEDIVCIERKGCVEEFANNLGRDLKRFKNELERMQSFAHRYIICEFPISHLIKYPYHSNNKKLQNIVMINGKYLLKTIIEIQMDYNVDIVFCDDRNHAEKVIVSIFKRVKERHGESSKQN